VIILPSKALRDCLPAVTAAWVALASLPALAQNNQGPPNALQGFSMNRDVPVKIEATTLEVRDKDKVATFLGNVHLVQGDTTMRCKSLVVYYEDNRDKDKNKDKKTAGSGMKAAEPGPGGQQQIRRIEAKGGVHVTQKDQFATGETGIFDMTTNTVTLMGNVVVTRGKDILRGHRLVVDLTTGVSRMEAGRPGQGRVEGLFQPSQRDPRAPPR
jgi:lipopolysaccharide export system protein LptA